MNKRAQSATTGKAGGLTVAGPSKGLIATDKDMRDRITVIPAKAGIQGSLLFLDPGFRRGDDTSTKNISETVKPY